MRHSLDQALGAPPVSTVNVDQIVARARRRGLRRRVTAAAGGTAVVAAGVVTALALITPGPPAPGRGQHVVRPGAASGAAPVRDGETSDQARQRLSAALAGGLTAALPGVQLSDGPTGQPGVVVYFDQGQNRSPYNTDTVLATATRQGEVFLASWPGGRVPAPASPTDWPSGQPAPPTFISWVSSCAELSTGDSVMDGHSVVQECQDSLGPAGQTVVTLTDRCVDCAGQPALLYDVFVTWTNARVNVTIDRDTKRGSPDESATAPLLTRDQVIAIATDPDLTVTS
jgi:hypothetical protein